MSDSSQPPESWKPRKNKQRYNTLSSSEEPHHWVHFSHYFSKAFLRTDPNFISTTRPNGDIYSLQHITIPQTWASLCQGKGGPTTTDPKHVEEAARSLQPINSKTPTCWRSQDGKELAWYLPKALTFLHGKGQHEDLAQLGKTTIEELISDSKPKTEKKDAKRYGLAHLSTAQWKRHVHNMNHKFGAWGRYIFGIWHAQGHTKSDPGLTADSTGTARRSAANAKWFPRFAPIFQAIGRILMEVDEWQYDIERAIFRHWGKQEDLQHIISRHNVSSRCCYLTAAILINQNVLPHRDKNDRPEGWVAMTVFGEFTGGLLGLPDLNAAIPFQPADVILFHSAVLEHYITAFQGQRYSCVFFTHDSLSRRLDVSKLAVSSRLEEENALAIHLLASRFVNPKKRKREVDALRLEQQRKAQRRQQEEWNRLCSFDDGQSELSEPELSEPET